MPEENGKKLQDLAIQGISIAIISVVAGGGGGYLAPNPPTVKDPQIAVLQEQFRYMHAELVVAETELAKLRMEVGMLKGQADQIGRATMRSMGIR